MKRIVWDNARVSTRLRDIRKASGYKSAKAFTDKFELVYSTYSQHEKGTRSISIVDLFNYCTLLNVSFDDFFQDISSDSIRKKCNTNHQYASYEEKPLTHFNISHDNTHIELLKHTLITPNKAF